MKRNNLYQRLRASLIHQVYKVPDLNRVCFASSLEQCITKFINHKVYKCNKFRSLLYVLFGI